MNKLLYFRAYPVRRSCIAPMKLIFLQKVTTFLIKKLKFCRFAPDEAISVILGMATAPRGSAKPRRLTSHLGIFDAFKTRHLIIDPVV